MAASIDYVALGKRLREARKAQKLSQEKLGELCDISTAHIGHIERGTRIPSLDVLFRLSVELQVGLDELVCDSRDDCNGVFKSISVLLAGKDGEKVKTFLTTVKALADKIDDL